MPRYCVLNHLRRRIDILTVWMFPEYQGPTDSMHIRVATHLLVELLHPLKCGGKVGLHSTFRRKCLKRDRPFRGRRIQDSGQRVSSAPFKGQMQCFENPLSVQSAADQQPQIHQILYTAVWRVARQRVCVDFLGKLLFTGNQQHSRLLNSSERKPVVGMERLAPPQVPILPLPPQGAWRWRGFCRLLTGGRCRSGPSPCGNCLCLESWKLEGFHRSASRPWEPGR